MVKLTDRELKRLTVTDVNVEVKDGAMLDDLIEQYGPGCYFDFDYGYYDETMTVYLKRTRLETDEEYEKRLEDLREIKRNQAARATEARKRRAEDERKTYERLKKKFEKN